MKTCNSCKENKKATEFYRDARTQDGLYVSCKNCHRLKVKSYANEHHLDDSFKHRKLLQTKRHIARSPTKVLARRTLIKAIKSGKLTRPTECSRQSWLCGGRIEGHHPDYSLPLYVLWLCKVHHSLEHQALSITH